MLLHADHATALWRAWGGDASSVVGVATLGGLYAAGVRRAWARAGRGRGVSVTQGVAYAAGIAVLVLALLSPLDALSESLFAAHMAQHVLLTVIVPPLLVLGAPMVAAMWALPSRLRRKVALSLLHRPPVVRAWRMVTEPLMAALLHAVVLWSWHAPRLYAAALTNSFLHFLEHATFMGSAMLIWWSILRPRRSRRAAYGVGIVVLFLTAMQSGVLGALLTLSQRVWYPLQHAEAASFGLTPLEDQQLAGLIMWVPAGLWYLGCIAALFVAWMREFDRRRLALAGAAAIVTAATLSCTRAGASVVAGGDVARGRATIAALPCGSCHMIPGVRDANGLVGPPLQGIAARSMIAGELANTPENMARWIADPQAVEPNTRMPNLRLSDRDVRDVVAYLYTLR